ncbi:phenylacetic acid degradation operon negative regulatory protein PaaX [Peristeroidobacter agariperforans]|uniref:phenylacetic acid degradation operon negative regulatory protein PaaX n=1 Tax=Peristeroidobacter agariperforans TaxID=268404 RepID=UPI0013005E94|nr:phenylacetic acid degradation operon negative regulatory protein PaaX [Peristeroidobacter agariperforans]
MSAKSHSAFVTRTNALVARFRRQRPLRGGSLLITILGDAIAPRGGTIALASLIKLAMPFGLTERLVRTSIGRLANEEWVSFERSGRASFYSLTTNGRARFAEATQRIYGAPPQDWDGLWTMAIVPPTLKSRRDDLREELLWLGFGQITPGVYAHPTYKESAISARIDELQSAGQLVVMKGSILSQAASANLVAMGWNLEDLARRYRRFIDMFAPVATALQGATNVTIDGDVAFLLRTLLLHEYRKVHLRDPLLPAALLPEDWAGADAQGLCRDLYATVFPASEQYLSATVQTQAGALPAPAAEIFQRFGGLPPVDASISAMRVS